MAGKRQFGNIRALPSARFQARFTSPNGSVVKAPTTFASSKRANDWLALQHAALLRGSWIDPDLGAVTLAEFAESWLEERDDLEPSSLANYTDHIRRFVTGPFPDHDVQAMNPHIGNLQLRHITESHVKDWVRWVREVSAAGALARASVKEHSPRWNRALRQWAHGQGFVIASTGRLPAGITTSWREAGCPGLPNTQRGYAPGATQTAAAYRTLHGLLASARRDGRVSHNPCSLKSASSAESRRRRPASAAELEGIIELMPERYAAAVVVAAWAGLRAGEVFGLARRHIDLERGSVTVERAAKRATGGFDRFGNPKTRAGFRVVHLPPAAAAVLETHMAHFTGPGLDALVFSTSAGRVVSSTQRTAMFRRAADAVGRSDLSFHDLRHTGATKAAEMGATTAQLMRRFGHASARASLIYQHAVDDSDRQLAARMG